MKATDPHLNVSALGSPARDPHGEPTVGRHDAVALVRHRIDKERLRTGDYDQDLWRL